MNKRHLWLIVLLCGLLLGGKGGCRGNGGSQSSRPPVPVTSPGPSQGIQAAYFAKLGLGGNYGPHYNAFNSYTVDGVVYRNYADAKNSVMQTSVPLDFQQMQDAGFKTVRAYGDTANVWVAMINEANLRNMNIVYTVALCGSDVEDPNHCCLKGKNCDVPLVKFYDLLDFAQVQLEQIIDLVGVDNFQQAVKLVLVGNEALVANQKGKENTENLIDAIIAIKALLVRKGVVLGDGQGNGVDVSTCVQIGQMTPPSSGQLLAQHFTPGAPVVENIYPFQFGDRPTNLSRLRQRVEYLQSVYSPTNNPVMIGETGWPTRGTYTNQAGTLTVTGSLADAQQYYQVLYPYLREAEIPTLIFEVYDQPSKDSTNNTLGNSEQNYGVFHINNTMKDPANTYMYPNLAYAHKPIYDTSAAAVFTLNGYEEWAGGIVTKFLPADVTITLTDPSGFTLSRVYKPFAMKITASGNQQMVWPSVNLYKDSTAKISFIGKSGQVICTNLVASVNTTPRLNPGGADFPAFSGGLWSYPSYGCPDCPKVEWVGGTGINAQNIFLHPDW